MNGEFLAHPLIYYELQVLSIFYFLRCRLRLETISGECSLSFLKPLWEQLE